MWIPCSSATKSEHPPVIKSAFKIFSAARATKSEFPPARPLNLNNYPPAMKSEFKMFSAARATKSEFPSAWPLNLIILQPLNLSFKFLRKKWITSGPATKCEYPPALKYEFKIFSAVRATKSEFPPAGPLSMNFLQPLNLNIPQPLNLNSKIHLNFEFSPLSGD